MDHRKREQALLIAASTPLNTLEQVCMQSFATLMKACASVGFPEHGATTTVTARFSNDDDIANAYKLEVKLTRLSGLEAEQVIAECEHAKSQENT